MKSYIVSFLIITLMAGCEDESSNPRDAIIHPTYQEVILSDTLQSIMKDFVQQNSCKTKYNEIFFDKVNFQLSIITLKSRHAPETDNGLPLYYTKVSDAIFLIYNGMEQYIKSDMKHTRKMEFMSDDFSCPSILWNIVDSAGRIRVIKNGNLPFSPVRDTTFKFATPME